MRIFANFFCSVFKNDRERTLVKILFFFAIAIASVSSDCLQRASRTGSLGDIFCIFQCSLFLIDCKQNFRQMHHSGTSAYFFRPYYLMQEILALLLFFPEAFILGFHRFALILRSFTGIADVSPKLILQLGNPMASHCRDKQVGKIIRNIGSQ